MTIYRFINKPWELPILLRARRFGKHRRRANDLALMEFFGDLLIEMKEQGRQPISHKRKEN